MSRQFRRLRLGLAATLGMALVVWAIGGESAGLAAAAFGLLAVLVQLAAAETTRRVSDSRGSDLMVEYAIGMGFRLAGVVLIPVAVLIDRATFPPGACAAGYLGTVLPLLWLETRLA